MKRVFRFIWQSALVVVVLTAFYAVYLDSTVTARFSDARFQAPALLYSRALPVTPDAHITRNQLLEELTVLDYQESRYARNPGEYQVQGTQLLLFRRAFEFADGYAPAQRVRLHFDDQGLLYRTESWPDQEIVQELYLEPQLIGRFASDNNEERLLVGLEQVPQMLVATLLMVEDQDFYHHHGVKPTSIVRAALANLAAGRTVQGGSTITQQLVKNMFLSHERSYVRKFNEAIMALILDFRFSKDEILEAYLNEVFFGQDRGHAIHGVELASRFYFGKSVEDLTPAETALLVGMIRGPSLYNPHRNPENAESRRDLVLRLMLENDYISRTQYLAAVEAPLTQRESTRFVRFSRPDYVDLVQRELRQLVPGREWQRTGLRVFTYFDPQDQVNAEQAVRAVNTQVPDNGTEVALVVSDYKSGTITALVGGRFPVNAGFNRATDARRQVGSLLKSQLYTTALENEKNYSLATLIDDNEITLEDEHEGPWTPRNFDEEFKGPVSLLESWVDSRNIPAVKVGMDITPELLRSKVYAGGVPERFHAYPSLLLGAVELTPVSVTQMYAPLFNQGASYRLTSIQGISTHRGDILYLRQPELRQVYTPEASYLARYALYQATQNGTARGLGARLPEAVIGGKTGSTNNLRDSWFVSADENRLVTVWLGKDDNTPVGLTGGRGALPVATDFWRQSRHVPLNLELPESVSWGYFDPQSGWAVPADCQGAWRLPVITYGNTIEVHPDASCDPAEQPDPEEAEEEDERSWFQRIFGRSG